MNIFEALLSILILINVQGKMRTKLILVDLREGRNINNYDINFSSLHYKKANTS